VAILLGGGASPAAFLYVRTVHAIGRGCRPAAAAVYSSKTPAVPQEVAMAITVEAVYENGMLKPDRPLPLQEHERVQITVASKSNWVQQTRGIMGFQGTQEEADYFAMDPDLDFPPPREEP
jgi:predicted DNA-binding antitoxin AbrB/MazE fold protein